VFIGCEIPCILHHKIAVFFTHICTVVTKFEQMCIVLYVGKVSASFLRTGLCVAIMLNPIVEQKVVQ
jgi:hypothetical protein